MPVSEGGVRAKCEVPVSRGGVRAACVCRSRNEASERVEERRESEKMTDPRRKIS